MVRGGAAPKMMEMHDHDHDLERGMLEAEDEATQVDLSAIRASVLEAAGNPVGVAMAEIEASFVISNRDTRARRAAEARMKGYEGDACGSCGNFTLVRNGTCMKCNTCGGTSGCS